MQRKSAHFLFIAVLGMLVIGIVMLFSTSAFALDAHGDVYFFIKRQSLWLGIGLTILIAAALVDYHFWYHTWCSGSCSRSEPWLSVSCRTSDCGSTARAAGSAPVRSYFSHRKLPRLLQYFFWLGGFRVLKTGPAT